MLLEKEVGLTVAVADTDSLGIICKVNDPVLHSLEISSFAVHFIKHAILPAYSRRSTEAT